MATKLNKSVKLGRFHIVVDSFHTVNHNVKSQFTLWMSVFFPFPVIHTVNHSVKRIDHNVKTPQFKIVEHTVIHSVIHSVIHTVNERVLSFSGYPHCEPQCETNRPQCENTPI